MFSSFRGSHGWVIRLRWCPYAPYVHIPPIHLDTPIYSESFNRVFILLYHKMFSYFRGSYGGLSDLGGIHMLPMFIHPPYIWTPPIYLDTLHLFSEF